jgi:hypothetical protein
MIGSNRRIPIAPITISPAARLLAPTPFKGGGRSDVPYAATFASE